MIKKYFNFNYVANQYFSSNNNYNSINHSILNKLNSNVDGMAYNNNNDLSSNNYYNNDKGTNSSLECKSFV